MNKKISVLFLSLLLLIFITPITISSGILINIENTQMFHTIDHLYSGWLEERDGVKILHLNGSYYEMGLQQGVLLKNEINANFRAFCNWIVKRGFSYEELNEKWNIMKPYLPQCYIDELEGVADGSGLSFENISVYNVGFYLVVNCGSFAAWGPATVDGRLYHARSHDFPIEIKDPITGIYMVETQVLIVRKPAGFYSSVSPSEAGMVTASDGINEMAIATGMLSSWTDDETLQGIDVGFRMRIVLDIASNITEALNTITSNKTLGYNFIVSDGKIPIGYAVETTANLSYEGTWDNPVESTNPFWKIDYVVRRANMFISPVTADTQRIHYDPSLFPLLTMLFKKNQMNGTSIPASSPWVHYMAISKGIESEWGRLDLNKTMKVLRKIYLGRTDIRFFILYLIGGKKTPYQLVSCPETGEFLVSFATRDKNAYENPTHYFNLFELLESYNN
jgi:hypothetical protein